MSIQWGWVDLAESEFPAARATYNMHTEFCLGFPQVVDILLKLEFYWDADANSENIRENCFRSYCQTHYLQTPYTLTAIYKLWRTGYYMESIILDRHLVESLVQMCYFREHPEKLEKHLTGDKRLHFKTMFDEVCPCLHMFYSKHLSDVAHGGISKDLFRVERNGPVGGERVVMGCEYNASWATYVSSITIVLLYGFLVYYPVFYPKAYKLYVADSQINMEYSNALEWLDRSINQHLYKFPKSHQWYLPLLNFASNGKWKTC